MEAKGKVNFDVLSIGFGTTWECPKSLLVAECSFKRWRASCARINVRIDGTTLVANLDCISCRFPQLKCSSHKRVISVTLGRRHSSTSSLRVLCEEIIGLRYNWTM